MSISWSSISTSPIPCTEWGGRPFSTQVRLRFGPGLHTDEKIYTIQELFYWARRLMMSSSISKGSTIDAYRRKGCPFLSNKICRESYCARWLDGSCKVYPLIDMMSLLHKFETNLPIIVLQFVSTCLLPVPTDVFLRHGRVEKEVGVLEERRNWGRTPTLQRRLC